MELAIKSLKYDATDFVTKPINDEVLEIALKRARERIVLRRQVRAYTQNLERLVDEKARQLIEAERMAAVGQTVAELSHTIKNIANALKGSIFVLGKGIELDEKEYLLQGWRMVEENVEKIKNLSLDLLHYGKYSRVNFRQSHPNSPAEEVLRLMAAKAGELGVVLGSDLCPDLQPMAFDPDGIQRCLMNLVENGLDAFRSLGASDRLKQVKLRTRRSAEGGVEYHVVDNGSGMDESVQQRLFQGFFSTKGTDGTGLGLMMTRRIVSQHEGTIEVHSRPGEGTTVMMRLPAGLSARSGS
jgi:signal transduction histidine kinase